MVTKARGKGTVVALAEKLIAGTNKHLANTTQVLVASGSFTSAQVTAQLQALVNLRNDVEAAKASTKAKLAAETADMPQLRTFLDAYVSFVKGAYSKSPDVLADFGLAPKVRTTLTVEAKTAAAAKRNATRAARHTMGSQQRKEVKGAVTGVVITPITASQPSVAVPAPGPNAPATSTGATTGTAPHITA